MQDRLGTVYLFFCFCDDSAHEFSPRTLIWQGAKLCDSAGDWASSDKSDRSAKGSTSGRSTGVTDSCCSVRHSRSGDLESARSIPGILHTR